jgi:hypothetical protein
MWRIEFDNVNRNFSNHFVTETLVNCSIVVR